MNAGAHDTALQRLKRKASEIPFFARLRVRLIALVLLAVLPALGLVIYTAIEQRQLGIEAARQETLRLVRFAAQRQQELIEGARQLLLTLVHNKEVQSMDQAACQELFASVRSIHRLYSNLGIILTNGEVFVSAVPVTQPVNLADRLYFRDALERRDFAVGDYQLGRIARSANLNVGYPIMDSNQQPRAVAYAALDLSWFPALVTNAQLPPGSSVTLADRDGITLARYPDPGGKLVGTSVRSANPRIRQMVSSPRDREYTLIGTGRDGIERLYAVKILGGREADARPATIALGIPLAVAHADANRALARNLLLLAAVTALALLAAWWMGDLMILRRVREMVAVTRRLSAGELEVRLSTAGGRGELQALARAFNEMAAAIQLRDEQQKKTEAQLLALNQRLYSLNAELEQRVEARTAELRQSNQDLQQFAYVASHDLQEPLRMVTHFVQLLSQRYQDRLGQDASEFIGFALDGARRMQQLIQDLLSYSRVGTRGEPFAPADCNQIVQRVLDNLRVAIEESGARVKCEPLPAVWGDAVQLSQVFQNLISNAIKFRGDQPPVVQLAARAFETPDELPAGHPGAGHPARWFLFSVRDNGIGIAAADFERIFVIFQRLHRREKYPGTGIGLSICKRIIDRHCGRIWVESEPGQGATFLFILPAPGEGLTSPAERG